MHWEVALSIWEGCYGNLNKQFRDVIDCSGGEWSFLMHCIVLTCGLQGTSAARLAGSSLALFSLHGWVVNLCLQLAAFWSIKMLWYFMVVRGVWAVIATAVLLGLCWGSCSFIPNCQKTLQHLTKWVSFLNSKSEISPFPSISALWVSVWGQKCLSLWKEFWNLLSWDERRKRILWHSKRT